MRTLTRRQLVQLAAALPFGGGLAGAQTARGGTAEYRAQGSALTLGNSSVSMSWKLAAGRLAAVEFVDHRGAQKIGLSPDLFRLQLEGGRVLRSSEMDLVDKPESKRVTGNPASIQRAGQRAGRQLTAGFRDAETGATITWRAILLDDSRYLRQEVAVTAGDRDVPLRDIALWDFDAPGAKAEGTVKGSPVAIRTFFLGFEHPLFATASPVLTCVARCRGNCRSALAKRWPAPR